MRGPATQCMIICPRHTRKGPFATGGFGAEDVDIPGGRDPAYHGVSQPGDTII